MLPFPILVGDRTEVVTVGAAAWSPSGRRAGCRHGTGRRGRPSVPIAEQAYVDFRFTIIDAVAEQCGSPSHDHGIGKMMKIMPACMQAHTGKNRMSAFRALKRHFNTKGIFDPGGRLGLDFPERDRPGLFWPRGDPEPR